MTGPKRIARVPVMYFPQSSDLGVPEALKRVEKALRLPATRRGSRLCGPYKASKVKPHHAETKPRYVLQIAGFEAFQAALAQLWPWLGEKKRKRAVEVLKAKGR